MSIMSLESSALTTSVLIMPEWSAISADSLCRTLCNSSAFESRFSRLSISVGKSQVDLKKGHDFVNRIYRRKEIWKSQLETESKISCFEGHVINGWSLIYLRSSRARYSARF